MDTAINNLSLCSGGAGLDLGLELVLPSLRTVCWVEREAFAIDYLATRMEEGCLSPAPIWSDLRTFDGKPWRGVVDCLTAGYPCQPFSTAGKRGGADDPRHLWPQVHRIIGEAEPRFVLLENVSGHTSLGGEQVIADLQGMGYEVAAGLFTAAEVGASHKRERFFILAVADDARRRWWRDEPGRRPDWGTSSQRSSGDVVNDPSKRRGEGRTKSAIRGGRCTASKPSRELAHAAGSRCSGWQDAGTNCCHEGQDKSRCTESERNCTGMGQADQSPNSAFPPGPEAIDQWQGVPMYLWPALEPSVCELVDGLAPDRTRWLRLLGNGVVPLQAAYAFVSLWSAIEDRDKPEPASLANKHAAEDSYALAV